jgi:hypothetical protein
MRVSQHAYWSRTKQPPHDAIEAHFERDGEVLEKYTADDLKAFRMSPEEIERQRECDRRDAELRRREDEPLRIVGGTATETPEPELLSGLDPKQPAHVESDWQRNVRVWLERIRSPENDRAHRDRMQEELAKQKTDAGKVVDCLEEYLTECPGGQPDIRLLIERLCSMLRTESMALERALESIQREAKWAATASALAPSLLRSDLTPAGTSDAARPTADGIAAEVK